MGPAQGLETVLRAAKIVENAAPQRAVHPRRRRHRGGPPSHARGRDGGNDSPDHAADAAVGDRQPACRRRRAAGSSQGRAAVSDHDSDRKRSSIWPWESRYSWASGAMLPIWSKGRRRRRRQTRRCAGAGEGASSSCPGCPKQELAAMGLRGRAFYEKPSSAPPSGTLATLAALEAVVAVRQERLDPQARLRCGGRGAARSSF